MAILYNKQITGTPGALLESLSDWQLLEPGAVMEIHASGAGTVFAHTTNNSSTYALMDGASVLSVPDDVRVTFTIVGNIQYGSVGFILRSSGDSNRTGYLARVRVLNGTFLQVYKITNELGFSKVAQKEYPEIDPTQALTVVAEVEGSTVRVWPQGSSTVLEWSDTQASFSSGSLGLYCYDRFASMDTVKVESLGAVQPQTVSGTANDTCEDTSAMVAGTVQHASVPSVHGSADAQGSADGATVSGTVQGGLPPVAIQARCNIVCEDTFGSTIGLLPSQTYCTIQVRRATRGVLPRP